MLSNDAMKFKETFHVRCNVCVQKVVFWSDKKWMVFGYVKHHENVHVWLALGSVNQNECQFFSLSLFEAHCNADDNRNIYRKCCFSLFVTQWSCYANLFNVYSLCFFIDHDFLWMIFFCGSHCTFYLFLSVFVCACPMFMALLANEHENEIHSVIY